MLQVCMLPNVESLTVKSIKLCATVAVLYDFMKGNMRTTPEI